MYNFTNLFREVDGDLGFALIKISNQDLDLFREVVQNHYVNILSKTQSNKFLESYSITEYHKFSDNVNHSDLWAKKNRILSPEEYNKFMSSDFFLALKKELGEINITDEEGSGYPEIYYRLVRPYPFRDVGPLHADKWFWDLGHGQMPLNREFKRVKFWCSLWNDNDETGFRFVPGSHLGNFQYSSENRGGILKPNFDESLYDLAITNLKGEAGTLIIFNDNLLHGGYSTKESTRLSFEFTLFI